MKNEKAHTLTTVTGPRGGRMKVKIRPPFTHLQFGARKVAIEEIPELIPAKGERRRLRKILFRQGFRNLAFRSVFN